MSVMGLDVVQASVDALKAELEQPEPGTVYVKVATLELTGVADGPEAVADVGTLIAHDPDVICLQGAFSWLSALTTAYSADWEIVVPASGDNIPILFRKDRWKVKDSGILAGAGVRFIVWANAVHKETAQKFRLVNTFAYVGPNGEEVDTYTTHMDRLAERASKQGRNSVALVCGSFTVDYIQREHAAAYWPSRVLGALNYSFCWSHLTDAALAGSSTLRGDGAHKVTSGVFVRKNRDRVAWAGTTTVATANANQLGVLATYETAVKSAEEPDEPYTGTVTPDQAPGGTYTAADLMLGSFNIKRTLSLSVARGDFADWDAARDVDLFGLQEMQTGREDFFATMSEFTDIHVQPGRGRGERGCDANPVGWRVARFAYQNGSGKAVLLTKRRYYEADGDLAGAMYATEAKVRDRLTGRKITIWSMHTPPDVEHVATGLPDYGSPRRVPVLLDCMAAMQRRALRIPDDELFVVTGDLNCSAEKKAWPDRPEAWFHRAGMDSAWAVFGTAGYANTQGSRHIDYIAISRRPWVSFKNLHVFTAVDSDHNAVSAKIRIQPA